MPQPVHPSPVYCAGCTPYWLSSARSSSFFGGQDSTQRPHPLHSSELMWTFPRDGVIRFSVLPFAGSQLHGHGGGFATAAEEFRFFAVVGKLVAELRMRDADQGFRTLAYRLPVQVRDP